MSARDEIAAIVREVLDQSGVADKRWRLSISGMIANRLIANRPDLVAEITGDEPRETVYWLLQRLGWTKTSETGRYEVWQRGTKRADEAMVLVPTDRSAMDYGYMMHRAEAALRTEFALLPMRAHEAQRADQ